MFTGFFSVINHSLELLVWIAIGLMLRPLKVKAFLPLLGLVVFVKMILQPALALGGAYAIGFPLLAQQVLFLEAAMPSGAIAAVLASRYGCDGPLAAALRDCNLPRQPGDDTVRDADLRVSACHLLPATAATGSRIF